MITGIAIGGFIGTIAGYALYWMISKAKGTDEQQGPNCPFLFDQDTCNSKCEQWPKCVRLYARKHD
jgi:hypothetical protein